MKSSDVLRVLDITRPTLTKYVKTGIIKVTTKPNGQYDYDEESVQITVKEINIRISHIEKMKEEQK